MSGTTRMPAVAQDGIGLGRRRRVRGFGQDAGAQRIGRRRGDLVLDSRRDQDVAIHAEQVAALDRLRVRAIADRVVAVHPVDRRRHVDPRRVGDGGAVVGDGDDPGARAGEHLGQGGAHPAEALDRDSCLPK